MSLYKRGNIWYMNFVISGHRVCKSTGASSKTEAKEVEEREKAKLRNWLRMTPEERRQEEKRTLTLEQAIINTYENRWALKKDGERIKRRTLLILGYLPKGILLSEIGEEEVTKLIHGLKKAGKKDATINRYLAHLKTVFHQNRIQPPKITMLAEPQSRHKEYSPEEEALILRTLKDMGESEMYDLVTVLIDTGMRLGEVLKLEWSDVHFDDQTVDAVDRKSSEDYTAIPMTKRVMTVLARRKLCSPRKPFTIDNNAVEHVWRKLRKKLGKDKEKGWVIHSLRHTFCSRAIEKAPIQVVQRLAGHKVLATTQRYAKAKDKEMRQAIKSLESYGKA